MRIRKLETLTCLMLMILLLPLRLCADELIPPLVQMKTDRPRLLLRPAATPYAISLDELRSGAKDEEYGLILDRLTQQRHSASAKAMAWLLNGEPALADSAIAIMLRYEVPDEYDTFHIHSRLTDFGLAYDWLYNYRGFTPEIRAELRTKILRVALQGLKNTNDHIFHNYVWMSGGGAMIWAMAVAGEDQESNDLYEQLRRRFNEGLYPAWRYLDGLPSEPLGYWAYYVFTPGMLNLLAAQSASETDITGLIEREQGGWMRRHFENMIHSVLPDMRFIPWGDLQSGPNGGVTIQFAGIMDALTWAFKSRTGKHWSRWLAGKRGAERFYGSTGIFYMLYTRRLEMEPESPPLSFLAGGKQAGHFIARSGWSEDATVVSLGCQDHYGDHHHYDQGGFMIYRQGLLAVDPPVYRKVAGPQQPTEVHNTLLIGGQNQRRCRGQWFRTLEEFEDNRTGGNLLETGDILSYTEAGDWASVSCQYAQSYPDSLVASCVRQLLFIRPDRILVVDQLTALPGKTLPEVQWLLQLPVEPERLGRSVTASDSTSWLTCSDLTADGTGGTAALEVTATEVNTHRVSYRYSAGGRSLTMVHSLRTGDGKPMQRDVAVSSDSKDDRIVITAEGVQFQFLKKDDYAVSRMGKP